MVSQSQPKNSYITFLWYEGAPVAVGEGLEGDGTPFQSGRRAMAAPFTQRHVEESWLHLLLAGDFTRLKDLTICNFDFLHAAVGHIEYLLLFLYHLYKKKLYYAHHFVHSSSDKLFRFLSLLNE